MSVRAVRRKPSDRKLEKTLSARFRRKVRLAMRKFLLRQPEARHQWFTRLSLHHWSLRWPYRRPEQSGS